MFSFLMDESTDNSVEQILAVMVRCFHDGKVFDALLDVVIVGRRGRSLYQSVKKLLQSKDIPVKNVLGFASDKCSIMMGREVGSRLASRW